MGRSISAEKRAVVQQMVDAGLFRLYKGDLLRYTGVTPFDREGGWVDAENAKGSVEYRRAGRSFHAPGHVIRAMLLAQQNEKP